jgi:hypothetical protein
MIANGNYVFFAERVGCGLQEGLLKKPGCGLEGGACGARSGYTAPLFIFSIRGARILM